MNETNIYENAVVVSSPKKCQTIINNIMEEAEKVSFNNRWPFTSDRVVVGFDCEGINLGVNGKVTLMQIATMTGACYIFDVLECPEMIHLGLKRLLESTDVVKIIHDCRNDSVNLRQQFGINLRMVFETQAVHAILHSQQYRIPVNTPKLIALNKFCQLYGAPQNTVKDSLKKVYRSNNRFWGKRPLSKDMIIYAAADVIILTNDKIYYGLSRKITEENQSLMLKLCNMWIHRFIY